MSIGELTPPTNVGGSMISWFALGVEPQRSLIVAPIEGNDEKSQEQKSEPQNGADKIKIMSGAAWQAPSHRWKDMKCLGDVR